MDSHMLRTLVISQTKCTPTFLVTMETGTFYEPLPQKITPIRSAFMHPICLSYSLRFLK